MAKSRKHKLHRITFNGDVLDEVVLDGMVHIEALDTHTYMIIVYASDGRRVHLHGQDITISDTDGVDDLMQFGPELLGCGHTWTRNGLNHRCGLEKHHEGKHHCDCAATRSA